MNGLVRMAIVLTTACLAAPAGAGVGRGAGAGADAGAGVGLRAGGQAAPREPAASRVRLVIFTTQPMNLTIDAQKDLQTAVKRLTAAIGFVRESDGSAQKPKAGTARARRATSAAPAKGTGAAESTPPPPGSPIGAYHVAGTVSSDLFDQLVAERDIPPELATERVRDQLLALKVSEFDVSLESVAGRPVAPPASLSIESKQTSDRAIEALELDVRESLAKWGIVLFGAKANPGPKAIQLFLLVDANECPTLPARLRRGFASRITKAACAI